MTGLGDGGAAIHPVEILFSGDGAATFVLKFLLQKDMIGSDRHYP
jgi:hypothetical protein